MQTEDEAAAAPATAPTPSSAPARGRKKKVTKKAKGRGKEVCWVRASVPLRFFPTCGRGDSRPPRAGRQAAGCTTACKPEQKDRWKVCEFHLTNVFKLKSDPHGEVYAACHNCRKMFPRPTEARPPLRARARAALPS